MSFDRQAVIHNLYISEEMSQAIGKMEPAELREDLRQEMFVVLCKMPDAMMQGLHERGELRWYMVRVMLNMVKSDRSAFYNKFRKEIAKRDSKHITTDGYLAKGHKVRGDKAMSRRPSEAHRGKIETLSDDIVSIVPESLITNISNITEDWSERISGIVEELDWYESNLLKLYTDMGNSCKPVAAATGISERGIRFAVARAKEKVKTKLRQAC